MTMKKLFAALALSLALAASALAEPPEVDRAEVLRLGNVVQHVDGVRGDPHDAFVEAMGPPAGDDDKWFISVLTMQGCGPCVRLKSEWASNQWLLALANPNDPKQSWAHYNVYPREDKSQAFRLEGIKVTAYPTILVQPPRNGRYGDPKTVVFQGTYGGDPERLARQITDAIRQYVAKFDVPPARETQTEEPRGEIGIDPPWLPPPRLDPALPNVAPVFPDGRPLIPPSVDPPDATTPTTGLWGTVGTIFATSAATLLLTIGVPWALQAVRQMRIDRGQPTLLSDEQFQKLLQVLASAGMSEPTAPSSASSAKPDK